MNYLQKKMVSAWAKQAFSKGVKRILIILKEGGEVDADIMTENQIVVEKNVHDFYKNFYTENKQNELL